MTGVDVEHTKALKAAATPGPVYVDYAGELGDKSAIIAGALRERYGNNALNFGEDHATAEYVAHIWNTNPALVAAVERVQAQVDKAVEILDHYNHSDDGELPECAPEDRWRLYRDLLATLNPEALETP